MTELLRPVDPACAESSRESATASVSTDAVAVLVDDRYDQHIRWHPGERLHHLFEGVCDALATDGTAERTAVSLPDEDLSYAELDARANGLARYLLQLGFGPGDRVGLLLDAPLPSYVAMLATLKINAAYVPLDPGFPAERIGYIVADAVVSTVITHSTLVDGLADVDERDCTIVALDQVADVVSTQPRHRLAPDEVADPVDDLCYVIYTSGSTGVPKGVPISHASICNFVRVADEVYGVRATDRMYQGMTIAFDFSVEEIWVAWMAGATLVPKTSRGALVGGDLRDFLVERGVTAMSCVPTLLATIEEDIPTLRFLLVSGEACPADLIVRWWRPDRRFLNVYGPTEATVTATWTPLHPDRPVTIGVPLPTYAVLILDPDHTVAVPRGTAGEVVLAGIGLSRGYLNRPDQTARAFVQDTLGVPNNPTQKLYRTGDLGRITTDGEIEYLGRIDTQVKIRGYRIELTEIESVLLQAPGVAAAVVEPYRCDSGEVELVGYVVRRGDCTSLDPVEIVRGLRDRLPAYMIPAFIEELDAFPLLPSDKVDRARLPAPASPRVIVAAGEVIPAEGSLERTVSAEVCNVLGIPADDVGVTAHFCDELGATSIRLAELCARLRTHPGLEGLRIADLYQHPTVRELAAAVAATAATDVSWADDTDSVAAATVRAGASDGAVPPRSAPRVSAVRWTLCAAYQALVLMAYPALLILLTAPAARWTESAPTYLDSYLRGSIAVVGMLVLTMGLPLLAKWVLIGRWKPREFPAWSVTYLRFWTVRWLLTLNPARLLAGSPLMPLYLRLLGAKVGPRTLILTTSLPVATDLLTVGADTVISRGALLRGYRIDAGRVRTGAITLGPTAYVGARSVLDIDTAMGENSQLGHASALLPGHVVPPEQAWHGVPARPTDSLFRRGPRARHRRGRPIVFAIWQLVLLALGPAPLLLALVIRGLGSAVPERLPALLGGPRAPGDLGVYELLVAATAAGYLIGLPLALVVLLVLSRVLARTIRPGVPYPVYGRSYALHRAIARLTNLPPLVWFFGDSADIVGYLSRLGYRLRPVTQTGSNFGLAVDHDIPTRCHVGTGTIVSDGLHFGNTDFTSTGFAVADIHLGARTFVGNSVHLPTNARIGDDMLLATKVAVPVDGPLRRGVGLLGSPCFEIPARVGGDDGVAKLADGRGIRTGLRRKTRYNRRSMALLYGHHLVVAILTVVVVEAAFELGNRFGPWPACLVAALLPWALVWWAVFVERAAVGFRRLQPRHVSLYHPDFWAHERFWKLSVPAIGIFDGTPFKAWYLRALGVRVGRRLLDDGCLIVERTMVTIGDYCTLGHQSVLQCHSLENSVFKSEGLVVADHATIAVRAFAHYGTHIGSHATVETDSFLMKGERVPDGARWGGNPAGPVT